MYIENLWIERFGQLDDASADGLRRQFNILLCPSDAVRDDARDFLSWLLFGASEASPIEYPPRNRCDAGARGTISVRQHDRRYELSRTNDGTRYGRLSLADPRDASTQDASYLLGNITQREFDVVFAPRFDLDPQPDGLLDAVRYANFDLTSRRAPTERPRQLEVRLSHLRTELDRLPFRDSVPSLVERRTVLTHRIEQATREQQRRRQALDDEYRDLSQAIEQVGRAMERQRGEYQLRKDDVDSRRGELEETSRIAEQAKEFFFRQREEELAELETRANRWQGILEDVRQRLAEVDSRLLHNPPGSTVDETCLVSNLAEQLDRLRRDLRYSVDSYRSSEGSGHDVGGYRASEYDTSAALDGLRREVSHLCRTLEEHRQNYKQQWLQSEIDHLRQCETVMSSWLDKLHEQCKHLRSELSDAERKGLTLVDDSRSLRPEPYFGTYRDEDPSYAKPGSTLYDSGSTDWRHQSPRSLMRAVAHSCDGYDVTHPDADAYLRDLMERRDTVRRELDSLEREADSLVAKRTEVDHQISRLSVSELDGIRRELEVVEMRLRDAERRESLTREIVQIQDEMKREENQLQPSPIILEASRIIHQLTQGRFDRVRIDDLQHVTVDDTDGFALNLRAASRELRGDVYLAVCLALIRGYRDMGIELPLVLVDPFGYVNAGHDTLRARVIGDFASAGHQVLLLSSRQRVADLFRGVDHTVVELEPRRDFRPLPPEPPELLPERRITEPEPDREFEDHVRFKRRLSASESDVARHTEHSNPPMPEFSRTSIEPVRRRAKPTNVSTNVGSKTARTAAALNEERHSLSLTSAIDATGVISADVAIVLKEAGIDAVRDFLELNSENLVEVLTRDGFATCPVRRWQEELALRCWVVGLTAADAELLVTCGITDVEKLAELESDELYDLLTRNMQTYHYADYGDEQLEYLRDRTHCWVRGARRSRTDWDRFRRRTFGQRAWQGGTLRTSRPPRHDDASDTPRPPRDAGNGRSTPTSEIPQASSRDPAANDSTKNAVTKRAPSQLRFFLNADDPLEDAPSIGPRTAKHFQDIGVQSVADFLLLNAEDAAAKIDNRRIKGDTIRQWQKQAALACRIPELRGHDAQILVACGIKDPTELARMEPSELWARVGPFAETSEGKRIIRSGKKPDLREMEDWIFWAQQSRTMKAA